MIFVQYGRVNEQTRFSLKVTTFHLFFMNPNKPDSEVMMAFDSLKLD
jgi:hypothetical protein